MGRPVLGKINKFKSALRQGIRLFLPLGFMVVIFLFSPKSIEANSRPASVNSCINCHQSLPDSRLSQPVQLWSESVHATVGNTCDGCHGGDPKETSRNAMSKENHFLGIPRKGEIASFCGKCHQETSRKFMTSPMSGALTCVDCHGSHTIHKASANIINPKKCTGCHDYKFPEKLKQILQSLHDPLGDAEDKVKKISGFPTEPIEKNLKKIQKDLSQVRMISHTFNIPLIQTNAEDVKAEITQATLEIDRLTGLSQSRKKWGYLIVLIFIGLTILTYLYNKQNQSND